MGPRRKTPGRGSQQRKGGRNGANAVGEVKNAIASLPGAGKIQEEAWLEGPRRGRAKLRLSRGLHAWPRPTTSTPTNSRAII
jgi:hypothetical protein